MNYYDPIENNREECPNECRDGIAWEFAEGEMWPVRCPECGGEGFIDSPERDPDSVRDARMENY